MSEPTQFVFSHKEVVDALLRKQGIHEGIWGLYVKFGIGAANIGPSPADTLPAAIVPLMELSLQKFEQENNIAVDAAVVNPKPQADATRKRRGKSRR